MKHKAKAFWCLAPKGARHLMVFAVFLMAYSLQLTAAFSAELLIDDFEAGSLNKLGGRANTYLKEPSRALALLVKDQAHGGAGSLMLRYDKKGKGGPSDSGGWCGWYTLLKSGTRYFDASAFKAITLWVKGASGGEDFMVGVSDRHWDEIGDSVKSEPIGKYLPAGKITPEWQKAAVPLDAFFLDHRQWASIAICFEGSLYPGGVGKGTVYLDDLMLE